MTITITQVQIAKYAGFCNGLQHVRVICRSGRLKEAVWILKLMDGNSSAYFEACIYILESCISKKALAQGKQVHANLVKSTVVPSVYAWNKVIEFYVKFDSLNNAQEVFDKMPIRDVFTWTRMIAGYAEKGLIQESLDCFKKMHLDGVKPDKVTFITVLSACSCYSTLAYGKQCHAHVLQANYEADVVVGSTLVNMYAKHGRVSSSCMVFDRLPERNIVSWSAMIAGYAQNKSCLKAMQLFKVMQQDGIKPNKVTFVNLLSITSLTLQHGKWIHSILLHDQNEADVFIGSNLVSMYVRCRSTWDAYQVFHAMPSRSVVSWNVMIAGYLQHGYVNQALSVFEQMQADNMKPDKATFVSVLCICGELKILILGKLIHADFLKSGYAFDVFVGSALVDMYVKCGVVEEARCIFEKLPSRDAVSWSIMFTAYSQNWNSKSVLELFQQMQHDKVEADKVTFTNLTNAYAKLGSLPEGKLVHTVIIKADCALDVFVGGALIDLYAKCNSIHDACKIFCRLPILDVVSWNPLIAAYAQCGNGKEAIHIFRKMQLGDVRPDGITFATVMNACAIVSAFGQGKQIHACFLRGEAKMDTLIASTLVDVYARCGDIEHAQKMLIKLITEDAVSWSAVIGIYVQHGDCKVALHLYKEMQGAGVRPSQLMLINITMACAALETLEYGKWIHASMLNNEYKQDSVSSSVLIDMYAKCGNISGALHVFDKLFNADTISWNAIIGACMLHDPGRAIRLIEQMEQEDLLPNEVTFGYVLSACSTVATLGQGKWFHSIILKRGYRNNILVNNTLIDMYGKCGKIRDARYVFDMMFAHDIVSYNSMICGYAQHGNGKEVSYLLRQMQLQGLRPNAVTFTCILSTCDACVDEGCYYLSMISMDHIITPNLQHYACIVDLLARAGFLYEAEDFIITMPFRLASEIWQSFIAACRIYDNHECTIELILNFNNEGTNKSIYGIDDFSVDKGFLYHINELRQAFSQ